MLQKLIARLAGHSSNEDNAGTAASVTHRTADISGWLWRYQEQHYQLDALVLDTDRRSITRAQSRIIDVKETDQIFLTAPLECRSSGEQASMFAGNRIRFSLNVNGNRHQFICVCDGYNVDEPLALVRFHFPQGIEQFQQRNAFRIKISNGNPIPIVMNTSDGHRIDGLLVDLSSSGMRVRLLAPPPFQPLTSQSFEPCRFVLGDGSEVECASRLVHWGTDAESHAMHFGMQFEKLSGFEQRTLNRYITELQRRHQQFVKD